VSLDASEAATETGGPSQPPSPSGYADPYEFEYPTTVLLIGSALLTVASAAAFGVLLLLVQGPEVLSEYVRVAVDGDATTVSVDLTAVALTFLAALVVTVVGHELLHGLAFRFYGYNVTYGVVVTMGAFYAAAIGQFQRRDELIRVGLAPLVVITALFVPLLAVPVPTVAIAAAFVLLLNTAGAIGDLYAVWRLGRMPTGTVMYDVDIHHSYVYEPLEP
jgi:hypothetical protein